MDFKNILSELKSLFLSGFFTIVPLAATIFFINFAYNFIVRIIAPLRILEPSILQKIPGSEFAIVILLILFFGIILKIFIIHYIIHYFERLLTKIPLVRIVYSSAKIVVDFFKLPDQKSVERKIVLIPYPKKGQYHIAFLLESAENTYQKIIPDHLKQYPGEKYYKVFMPNSPNVAGGYFFIMSQDEIIPTDITFEEAIKILVSCGLVTPETLKKSDSLEPKTLKNS
jgi:uncharacterized membrane protein